MRLRALEKQDSHFKIGLQGGVPVAIGYIPIAVTYGFLARSTGLSLRETVLMSLLVFVGAAQLHVAGYALKTNRYV